VLAVAAGVQVDPQTVVYYVSFRIFHPPCLLGGRVRGCIVRCGLCFFPQSMRASVYVDALNLYYGALKGTRYKWLNPSTLCDLLLPHFDICRVKYFTALVRARPD